MPQTKSHQIPNKPKEMAETDINELPLGDLPVTGQKGGQVQMGADDTLDQPLALVDFLWKHHND